MTDRLITPTQLADKRVDMLAKATADARDRARVIAREAGAGIGAITNADTGIFQITAPYSTETSDSGTYDTSTIDKDITAVMSITFRVDFFPDTGGTSINSDGTSAAVICVVPLHKRDLAVGTLASVLRQAGIDAETFIEAL